MSHDELRRSCTRMAMALSLDLPSVKFFKPTLKFLAWMTRIYTGSLVYDVGAGCGHVTKALLDKGLKSLAIDINNREEEEAHIQLADGEFYCYAPDSVVMLCRPCHGEFVERVIAQAMKRGAAAILYVGLGKNVKDDLGRHLSDFRKVLTCAGREGEFVMRWRRKKSPAASSWEDT